MKIAYIATGAAGMLCGTCIHDNTLAATLTKLGHDVALIPTYTPLRTDEENVSIDRVFLGGVNVYLQEKFSLFRHTPESLDNLLNSKSLLSRLSKFSTSTNAAELGSLTVSVLKGEDGHQRKELQKLVRWLKEDYHPDIVQLNHSLLIGFAREIKNQLKVPVVCGFQGEDLFLDTLVEPFQSQALALLRAKINHVDAMIATCDANANFMAEYLDANREKIYPVYPGIDLDGHGEIKKPENQNVVIGFLARICPEKGLHLLVEAFHQLHKKHGDVLKLRVAGYLSNKDRRFLQNIQKKIQQWGLQNSFEFVGEVDRNGKIDFLGGIDIFSVPTVHQEAKGLSILEALANGVPALQPKHGIFPEVITKTGGGILVEPNSANSLADGLESLIVDPNLRIKLGTAGTKAVQQNFSAETMARGTLAVYQKCLFA